MNQQTQVPQEVQAFAYQHNLDTQLNDRKFYGKYRYRISVGAPRGLFNNRIVTNLREAVKLNGLPVKVRWEGHTVNYYTNDLDDLDTLMSWIKTCPRSYQARLKLISYSLDIARNIRLRKKRLPQGGAYEVQIRDGYELAQCREFIKNYEDKITPNWLALRSIDPATGSRSYYGYNRNIKFKDEMILQLFTISYSEAVKRIIEYKLVEDVENAAA